MRAITRHRWLVAPLALLMSAALALPAVAGHFTDVDPNSEFAADIEYIAGLGVTLGCTIDGTKYCPKDPVTRGQMASFLVRAFNLPSTTTDFFADDDGNIHEADINALRAAGITTGCAANLYCPDAPVTRAQMAAFIRRALGIPQVNDKRFVDVAPGVYYFGDATAILIQQITKGCKATPLTYCPDQVVTREQMAAFLARALRLGGQFIPAVIISSPADLQTFVTSFNVGTNRYEATVNLSASVSDPDGDPTTVSWSSNVHGFLGFGTNLTVTLWIPAGQTSSQPIITAVVSDADGSSQDQVQIKLILPSPQA